MFDPDQIRRVLMDQHGLQVTLRNDGVSIFLFRNFARSTIEAYVAYLHAAAGYIKPDSRNLFDLRQAGMPSQYLWELSATLYAGIDVPETVKNAVLLSGVGTHNTIMRQVMRRLMTVGTNRVFFNERDALVWLNEGHETD